MPVDPSSIIMETLALAIAQAHSTLRETAKMYNL